MLTRSEFYNTNGSSYIKKKNKDKLKRIRVKESNRNKPVQKVFV